MIEKLQHQNKDIATHIRSVFQASYAVEAKLLNAIDFPPLKRNLDGFITSNNNFFGFIRDQKLVAVVEINHIEKRTHIQSLVVHPDYFRKGIGHKLVAYVLHFFNIKPVMVETGVANIPAIALYKKFHFIEVAQWDTDHGVRKLRLELKFSRSLK